MAGYFSEIFSSDWDTASRQLVMKALPRHFDEGRAPADGIPIDIGDIDEV